MMTDPGQYGNTAFARVPSVAEVLGDRYTDEMKAAFPDVDPPYGVPFGYLCLLQLRQPKKMLGSGLLYAADETRDNERYRVQAALVRAVGSAAFTDRQTSVPWKEGSWFQPGDFIRSPMYGGDRFDVDLGRGDEKVTFVFIREADAVAPLVVNPLSVKTS
jgi:hypothetical protein